MNPYSDDWDTGDLAMMSKEQIFKSLHYFMTDLLKTIRELRRKMGWSISLSDVVALQFTNSLLAELQKKFFDREVIPVEK